MRTAVLLLLSVVLFSTADDVQVGGMATVKIRDQHLFPRPVHYAQPIAEVAFGTEVNVVDSQGAWYKVQIPGGVQGWLHSTSLTGAVLSRGTAGGEQDPDMIMLAGRGFNADVEASYAQGKDLRFDLVDRMEEIRTSPEDVGAFLAEGGLIDDEPQAEGRPR